MQNRDDTARGDDKYLANDSADCPETEERGGRKSKGLCFDPLRCSALSLKPEKF